MSTPTTQHPQRRARRITIPRAAAALAAVGALAITACGQATSNKVLDDARALVAQSGAGQAGSAQNTQSMPGMPGMNGMPTPVSIATPDPNATPNLPEATPVVTGDRKDGVVNITLTAEAKEIEIAPGLKYKAWTFGGHVPGPVVRVTEGDRIHFTLINRDTMPHSIDFHAAQIAPDKAYQPVNPGASLSFDWTANHPGVFEYHCGAPLVIEHMANGMYGAIIVDPKGGRPAAREYALVQSEWYNGPGDIAGMTSGHARYTVFNGYANRYKLQPLTAKPGELIRLYVVDAGPNHWSAFHVVGALFSTVEASGSPEAQTHWVQTATVAPGDGAVFELTIPDAGTYPFVTHDFSDVTKGAVGVIKVSAGAAAQSLAP